MNKLFNNAIISIKLGVDDYFSSDPNRILSCVRNLFSGLLLLFKSKLLDLSPPNSNEVLIKKNIIPIIDNNDIIFKGAGNNTIGIDEIRKRFLELNINTNWSIIEKMRKERNNIEHYYLNIDINILRGFIVDVFHVTNDFIKNELRKEPRELLKETWTKMLDIESIFINEKNECDKKIYRDFNVDENQLGIIRNIYCNQCGSELLIPKAQTYNLDEAILICTICSKEINVIRSFENIIDTIYNSEIENCPECNKKAFYTVDNICFYCSYEKII
jgi:hypothetical protein